MGAVESDSVKSASKAKDKLHKACERGASKSRNETKWKPHPQVYYFLASASQLTYFLLASTLLVR